MPFTSPFTIRKRCSSTKNDSSTQLDAPTTESLALSVHARLRTLLLFHYTRTHTNVQNLERTLKTNFHHLAFWSSLVGSCYFFWITGAAAEQGFPI